MIVESFCAVLNVTELVNEIVLEFETLSVAETVDANERPLMLVAVAAPRAGNVSVGLSRVLFVKVCISSSVTSLWGTEPSQVLQYPPLSNHWSELNEVTRPPESVVLFNWIPPLLPVKLSPVLSSILLSATIKFWVLIVVVIPVTSKSPPTVTVDPSSVIILLVNWKFELSHLRTVWSFTLSLFFRENEVPDKNRPPEDDASYVVSWSVDAIVIVFPSGDCSTVVTPEPRKVTSPDVKVPPADPLILVMVLVSIELIVMVAPSWDWLTVVAPDPVKVTSPELNEPVLPPFNLVIVSTELIVISLPVWSSVTSLPAIKVKSPAKKFSPVPPLNLVMVSVSTESIIIVDPSWDTDVDPEPEIEISPDVALPPTALLSVVIVSVSIKLDEISISLPVLLSVTLVPAIKVTSWSVEVPDPPDVNLKIFLTAVVPSTLLKVYVVFVSVVVTDPPRAIVVPLIVIEEFSRLSLVIFVIVFAVPEILQLLKILSLIVCTPVKNTSPVKSHSITEPLLFKNWPSKPISPSIIIPLPVKSKLSPEINSSIFLELGFTIKGKRSAIIPVPGDYFFR